MDKDIVKIIVIIDGQEVDREFTKDKFVNYCDVGLEINEMIESLENSYRHNF